MTASMLHSGWQGENTGKGWKECCLIVKQQKKFLFFIEI